jgi:hypothetical protein
MCYFEKSVNWPAAGWTTGVVMLAEAKIFLQSPR